MEMDRNRPCGRSGTFPGDGKLCQPPGKRIRPWYIIAGVQAVPVHGNRRGGIGCHFYLYPGSVKPLETGPVLTGVSFQLPPGEKAGLIGPNGFGKPPC